MIKSSKNKALAVVLTLAMVLSTFAGMTVTSFATDTAVTEIASLSGITSLSGNYKLTSNITIDASGWTPIGSESTPFTGTFDGDGHTITWSGTKAGQNYFGVFGKSTGTVTNVNTAGSLTITGSADYISPVVGYNAGTITSVTNNAAVTAVDCYNVGGIAGFNDNYYTAGSVGVISNCDNTAAVNGVSKTGGIVGENAGRISDCTNSGDIRSYGGGKDGTGGIAGRNGNNNTAVETGIIENCSNSGNISDSDANGTLGRWVGGIAGFQNSLSKVTNCSNTGTITAYKDGGDLIGKNEGIISESTEIEANTTISSGGSYSVAANSVITVSTSDAVTIQDNGTAHAVTINCTTAANLTIKDLDVTAPSSSSSNIINFTTGENTLNIQGENLLENDRSAAGALNKAAVRVPAGVTLNVTGDGTLYLYKNSMGAGFGSDTDEASGTINFNHTGAIYAKGSMTGAVIGGDTGVGPITVNSGNLNIFANARGAGIGGSAQCDGGSVVLNGGNVKITCAWSGHAIGSGASASNGGTLTITKGSLYVEKTSNSTLGDDELINATIPNNAKCLTLPISSTFSGGEFTVSVDGSTFYTGKVNLAKAIADATTTKTTWDQTAASEVYLWIPGEDGETITININKEGGTSQTTSFEYSDVDGWI